MKKHSFSKLEAITPDTLIVGVDNSNLPALLDN